MRIMIVSPFPAERVALRELLADDGHHVPAVATRSEGLALALTVSANRLRPSVSGGARSYGLNVRICCVTARLRQRGGKPFPIGRLRSSTGAR